MTAWEDYMKATALRIGAELDHYLPPADMPERRLHEAMRYSVFAGGKRLRPLLLLAVAESCGLSEEAVMPAACALEMIHTYSLIHDDLPSLDNDDYRRGKLTNHKVFGEATALLAGDALLTLAFETLLACQVPAESLIIMQKELAQASGVAGMIGGQMGDMLAEGRMISRTELEWIHARKTGALLTSAARLPLLAANADAGTLTAITIFARAIGLAFQIQDDILDVTGDSGKLGKSTGADATLQKATFPALVGLTESRALVAQLTEDAIAAVRTVTALRSERLVQLAQYLQARDH